MCARHRLVVCIFVCGIFAAPLAGQLQPEGSMSIGGSTCVKVDWHIASKAGTDHVFNAGRKADEAMKIDADNGKNVSVVFGGDGRYVFRVTPGKPAIRMVGDGYKTVSFHGTPNFIYAHDEAEPKAIVADGNCAVKLFGKPGERNIFLGSIILRDEGSPGRPQLAMYGGDWLLVGTLDGVDIVTLSSGTSYSSLRNPLHCIQLQRRDAILHFRLLESIVNSPFGRRADGIRISTQCNRTKLHGRLGCTLLQTCEMLSIGKSFAPKLFFLPSSLELSIASAIGKIRDLAALEQFPISRRHRQHAAALSLRRAARNIFVEGHFGGLLETSSQRNDFLFNFRHPSSTCWQGDGVVGLSAAHRRSMFDCEEFIYSATAGIGRRSHVGKCKELEMFALGDCGCAVKIAQTFLRSTFELVANRYGARFSLDRGIEVDLHYALSKTIHGDDAMSDRLSGTISANLSANWPRLRLEVSLSEHISKHMKSSCASVALLWCF